MPLPYEYKNPIYAAWYGDKANKAAIAETETGNQYRLAQIAQAQAEAEAARQSAPFEAEKSRLAMLKAGQTLRKDTAKNAKAENEYMMQRMGPLVSAYRRGDLSEIEFRSHAAREVEQAPFDISDEQRQMLYQAAPEHWAMLVEGARSLEDQGKADAAARQAEAYSRFGPQIGMAPEVASGVDPATINAIIAAKSRKEAAAISASARKAASKNSETLAGRKLFLSNEMAEGRATPEMIKEFNLLTNRDLADQAARDRKWALEHPTETWMGPAKRGYTPMENDDPLGIFE